MGLDIRVRFARFLVGAKWSKVVKVDEQGRYRPIVLRLRVRESQRYRVEVRQCFAATIQRASTKKGRLKVPAEFKRRVDELYGPQFFITSRDGKRAEIYPMKEWEKIEEALAKMPVERGKAEVSGRNELLRPGSGDGYAGPPAYPAAAAGTGRAYRRRGGAWPAEVIWLWSTMRSIARRWSRTH